MTARRAGRLAAPAPFAGLRRGGGTFAALALLLSLVGCGGGGADSGPSSEEYARLSTDLVTQLEATPGAQVRAAVQSGLNEGRGNVAISASLPAAASRAQLDALADRLERTVWLSRLRPLGRIIVSVSRQGAATPDVRRIYQSDTRPLSRKYGPRPA